MHITSLPGSRGIGTLGQEARGFADFCSESGFSWWQILPVGPVTHTFGYSPYSSHSAFAINRLFISLEDLQKEEWCHATQAQPEEMEPYRVAFPAREEENRSFLSSAHRDFSLYASDDEKESFIAFRRKEGWWLEDYALFEVISRIEETGNWTEWEDGLRSREPSALQAVKENHSESLEEEVFVQYIAHRQWQALKEYCDQKDVKLFGDIPFYITADSVDAWTGEEMLQLDKEGRPQHIAGVPPDYFSETGQRWGNPLYAWYNGTKLNQKTLEWWGRRITRLMELVDLIRIDHFRAFAQYWAIPSTCKTAIEGEWLTGPGKEFFDYITRRCGHLPLVAEDLGIITEDVTDLRDEVNLPGMKILQFAFDGSVDNLYLPHSVTDSNTIYYTGTHDNNTINGWFYSDETDEETRSRLVEYLGFENRNDIHWKCMKVVMASPAKMAVFPMQDILGYGEKHRMNRPGTSSGNWSWRLETGIVSKELSVSLKRLNTIYNRLPVTEE